VMNDLDRFHLVADVIDRIPLHGSRADYAKQALRDKRFEHKQYIAKYGEDMRRSASGDGAGKGECLLSTTSAVFSPSHPEHSEGMQIHVFDTGQRECP